MKGRHELDSCSEEGDPVQLFLEIRLGLFINLDISYLHNFKRWFYDSIWMDQVLIIKWNFVRKAELQELLLGEKDIGEGYCRGVGGNVVHFIVAISYVIVPEQYNGRINAESFFSFLLEHFTSMPKNMLNLKPKPFQRIFWKPSLLNGRLALENLLLHEMP